MGTAALTLGFIGLISWVFPFLGFPVCVIGLILGVLALLLSPQQRGRAIAGIIMCVIGLALNIGVVVGLVTAGLILEEILPEYFRY